MKKFLFFLIFLWCSGLWAFPARQNICSGSTGKTGDITVIAAPGNLIASVALDDTTFITGGKSLLLSSSIQKSMHADVPVYGILPGKKYRLSFFCRLENVRGEGLDVSLYCGPGKGISPMARRRLNGTLPWHRLVFELDIPESYDARKKAVIFTLRRATGKVWVDHLQIEEISAQPLARVGIITDTHVTPDIKSCAVLEKALRLFKKHKVDMIVNCGDIADRHREKAYQNYRATVKKVYPSGKPKELFAFANHDILDVATRENAMTKAWPLLKKRLEIEHDCYSKHYLAGCIFLTAPQIANWSVYEKMISDACKETPGKPVFLVDHVPAANTTFDTKTWGYAASRKIFNKYPQIVQLSGHVHGTLRNEQNIWQGEFTVVNAGCTGQFWGGGLIGTPPPERWSEDALIMEIWSQKLVFRRFDLRSGREYRKENPWCIPLPFDPRTAPYTSRQRKKLPPPEFAPQSRITFSPDQLPCNQLRVSFPDARGKDGTYIYRITLFEKQNNQWKRFSKFEVSGSYLKEENKRTQTLLKLSAAYFESGKEYRIQIDPVDFFGNTGKALCGEFTMPQKRKWQTVFESDDPGKECAFLSSLSGGQPLKRKGGFFQHDVWEARLVFPGNVWQAPAETRFRFTVDLHMKQPSPEKQWTLVLRNPVPPANANVRISTPSGDSGLQRYVIEFAKARDFYNYYLLIREGKPGEIKFHHIKIEKFVEKEKQKCK